MLQNYSAFFEILQDSAKNPKEPLKKVDISVMTTNIENFEMAAIQPKWRQRDKVTKKIYSV